MAKEDLKAKLKETLSRIEEGLKDAEFTPNDRNEISRQIDSVADEMEEMLHQKMRLQNQDDNLRTAQSVLAEIFTQSPLPNKLKTPKQRWYKKELRETAQAQIIREYSDYTPKLICVK